MNGLVALRLCQHWLDEWFLEGSDEPFCGMLLELTGLRHGSTSTIFCARPKRSDWHAGFGDGVDADAIMGRIVSEAVWLNMARRTCARGWLREGSVAARPVLTRDISGLGL